MPMLIAEGVLPPFWRWLAFRLVPAGRAREYRMAARSAPRRSSGWLGCHVVLPVWAAFGFLTLQAILAIP